MWSPPDERAAKMMDRLREHGPCARFGGWVRMMVARLEADFRGARLRSVRKSIWKTKNPKSQRREDVLLQLSRLELGEDYALGIASVDAHHKIIALVFNGLVREVSSSGASEADRQSIYNRISLLVSSIGEHFVDEEREMAEAKYLGASSHKKQHDEFLVDVMMLMESMENEDYGVEEFIFFIGSWWSGHLLISDRRFGDFIADQAKQQHMT